jgi:LicD family
MAYNTNFCTRSKNKLYESFIGSNNINLSPKLKPHDIVNLKKGQKMMTRMLYIFDKICKKHNITYFAIGGTLLGAIVYKGWIPWDGDLDIEILKQDWPKLNNALKNELPKDLWLQTEETDKHYKSWNKGYVMGKIRNLNSCYVNSQDGVRFHNGFMMDLNLFYIDNTGKVMMPDNKKITYLTKEDIFPLKRVAFDNILINIPRNSSKYLVNNYGKFYYKDLPVEKRYPHEGLLVPNKVCDHHYKLYPHMYKQ